MLSKSRVKGEVISEFFSEPFLIAGECGANMFSKSETSNSLKQRGGSDPRLGADTVLPADGDDGNMFGRSMQFTGISNI